MIVDRVRVEVWKGGKKKGSKIAAAHLNTMLGTETFLGQFRKVDLVTTTPAYLPDFTLTRPGLNGGDDQRILYVGPEAVVSDSLDAINAFLDVMAFETEADRTNAVAGALTVLLRNHLPGGKPVLVVTSGKSHAGKDTVITFASGMAGSISISYQGTNWALERSFVGAVKSPRCRGRGHRECTAGSTRSANCLGVPRTLRHRPGAAAFLHGDRSPGSTPERHRAGDLDQLRKCQRRLDEPGLADPPEPGRQRGGSGLPNRQPEAGVLACEQGTDRR